MTYSLEDIELMITNLPRNGVLPSLDEGYLPQRRHIKAGGQRLSIPTRPRKIVNCLTEHFQDNPIPSGDLDSYWQNSNIPYFVYDLLRTFQADSDVKRLMQIPNIKLLR